MTIPDELIAVILANWPVARLGTLSKSLTPHLVPIVFVQHDDALWSPIDGKPKSPGEPARVRHLRACPAASLLLDHFDADWTQLWWLRLDGLAEIVEGSDAASAGRIEPVAAALLRKYPQYGRVPLFSDQPVLLRISPIKTISWCAGADAIVTLERICRLLP